MRLCDKYRPKSLAEIIGQPEAVKVLSRLVAHPERGCVLLEGSSGTGKSAAAHALAHELGCYSGWLSTCYSVNGANLTADVLRYWFGPAESPLRLMAPNGWHVLVIEELEYANKVCGVLLKDYLDTHNLRSRTIVVATSNDSSALPRPVKARFGSHLRFKHDFAFAEACWRRLQEIWALECPGRKMPSGWGNCGWEDGAFSMREALNQLQDAVTLELEEISV